jgi:predicted sulfurtransferase
LKQWLDEGRPVILYDTRNDYEVRLGTFKGAKIAGIGSFREFPEAVANLPPEMKDAPIVSFCTGGIRCEKAAPFMEREGFKHVWQLEGGILKYFEECGSVHFDGELFVFDQRVSVGHGLALGKYVLCPSCRHPISDIDRESGHYEEGVSCPNCGPTLSDERRAAARERQKQIRLAEARGEKHIGARYDSAPEG